MPVGASWSREAALAWLLEPVLQHRYQRPVGWRHAVFPKFLRKRPRKGLTLAATGLTLPDPTKVERHQEMERGIGMRCEAERRKATSCDSDTNFLPKFAGQSHLRCLAKLQLPAREFPIPGERLSLRSLRDQEATVAIHQRARDSQLDLSFDNRH